MGQGSIEERVRGIAERVALDHGLELVHAEVAGPEGKPIIRIFIDKPEGVTHNDCSDMSLHVGTVLDVAFQSAGTTIYHVLPVGGS